MKKLSLILALVMSLAVISGCSSQPQDAPSVTPPSSATQEESAPSEAEPPEKRYLIMDKLESEILKANLVNEETTRDVCVFLPPSYYDSEKTYPVIYFFHGFGDGVGSFFTYNTVYLNTAFEKGAKEFIIVGVDGDSISGGSFYQNSPVSGNWEDYVIDEVIPFVDTNYRTIKDSKSRGVLGFSMGGYGAYNIALKHPDVVSAMMLIAPGLFADGDFPSVMESWASSSNIKTSYARAFSPNKDIETMLGNIPTLSGTPEDNAIVEDWIDGYGNIHKDVDAYLALNNPLTSIKIIYGEEDAYPWIPKGCVFFADYLKEKNIAHSIESFPLGHTIPSDVVDSYFLPFFSENLTY